MQQIETILNSLADLANMVIIWKQANGSGCGLSDRHTYHECEFCLAVKSDPVRSALCSHNDSILLATEAEAQGKPFLHRCHAGVVELVVPRLEEERCRDFFLAGISRREGDRTAYPACEPEYAKLPVNKELPFGELEQMLNALAPLLAARRDRSCLNDVKQSVKDPRIAAAAAAIRRRPGESFDLATLARRACLGESRFAHLFRKETGQPFSTYLAVERIREAKRLLRETDLPLLRIALECGFHDQSHFSGRFRRETGLTPLTYRKEFGQTRNT